MAGNPKRFIEPLWNEWSQPTNKVIIPDINLLFHDYNTFFTIKHHMLLLARTKVFRENAHDTICINVKGNLNLRNATACGRNPIKTELTKRQVITSKLVFALKNVDVHLRLIVRRRREHLALLGRDGRVALDEAGRDAALGLNRKRMRGHIKEQDVARVLVASQLAALDGSADRHSLVRVEGLARLASREGTDLVLHGRDTGGTTDQKNLREVGIREASILHDFGH